MKKTYIKPEILVVRLQHQGLLMDSLKNITSNVDLCGAGADGSITGGNGDARTKESGSIWDEEW